jgi:serine/threonine protein kinase
MPTFKSPSDACLDIMDPNLRGRSADSRVVAALEEFVALTEGGERPSRHEFLARHAEIADGLSECLDGLGVVQGAARSFFTPSGQAVPEEPRWSHDRLGDYRIVTELGRGGMGIVYEAEQVSLGRRVALKVLPFSSGFDPRQRQRFQVEAQAAAHLNHPHIVPVFAVGHESGVHYFAMRLIEGKSLAEIIRDLRSARSTADGRQSAPLEVGRSGSGSTSGRGREFCRWVARLGLQAAEGLDHAHSIGVIHRDIKPSNLLVDGQGHLWITDFGLARVGGGDSGLTRTGDLIGTLAFMSPEQVRGDRLAVDPRSDVYALGATLYELLTLQPAFDAPDRQELIRRVLHDEPLAPRRINSQIPRDLETIILRAMAKEPAGRYGSARALADDLIRFRDDRPIEARRPGVLERTARWARRHRPVVLTGAGVLCAALAMSTALLWQAKRRTDAALAAQLAARGEERVGLDLAIALVEQVTELLAAGAKGSGPLQGAELDPIYHHAISFCDRVAEMKLDDKMRAELTAKARRRSGALRALLGQTKARDDYRQAIRGFGEQSVQHPEFIWLRAHLIETLREYAALLARGGDRDGSRAATREAVQVADGLVGKREAAAHCFSMQLAGPFSNLAWDLIDGPAAGPRDAATAIRLARQATAWEPTRADCWTALGAAHLSAGAVSEAATALEKARSLTADRDPTVSFLLALVHHKQGDAALAQRCFEQAATWLRENPEKPRNPLLRRVRAEAEKAIAPAPRQDHIATVARTRGSSR